MPPPGRDELLRGPRIDSDEGGPYLAIPPQPGFPALGGMLDVLDDGVAVGLAGGERQQDVEDLRGERKEVRLAARGRAA